MVVNDDDGAAGHFTARATRRGYGDQRRDLVGNKRRTALNGGVAGEWARVGGRNCHTFGTVNGGTPAHRDQSIAGLALEHLDRSPHSSLGRVGRRLVVHGAVHS